MRFFITIIYAFVLSSCASVASGTLQNINVTTNPEGASCEFVRDGRIIGNIQSTPGIVQVDKTKFDIAIKCSKDGYPDAEFINKSDMDASTFGNILLGGAVGWAIDSARGADNRYEEHVHIDLTKE